MVTVVVVVVAAAALLVLFVGYRPCCGWTQVKSVDGRNGGRVIRILLIAVAVV